MRTAMIGALAGLCVALAASAAIADENPGNADDTLLPGKTEPPVPAQPLPDAPIEEDARPAPTTAQPPSTTVVPVPQREVYQTERVEPVVVKEPVLVQQPAPRTVVVRERTLLYPWGMAVSAGGGVMDFAGDSARDMTGTAGQWDARLAFGTRQAIGFEAAYIGTAGSIDAIGLDTDAMLVSNGAEGLLRVNFVPGVVQPYAFGGVAWRRYDLTNTDTNTSDVIGQDDVLEVPLGVGLGFRTGSLILDARAAYRIATDEDLIPNEEQTGFSTLDSVNVSGHIGVEF